MKKSPTRQQLIKQLDKIFSEYIRRRDANEKGIVQCPLCQQSIFWKESQNMHFISRSIYKYRRDETNCHAGCMRCNVILHGNYIIYTRWMQNKYGMEYIYQMINDKQIFKMSTAQIKEKITYYSNQLSTL